MNTAILNIERSALLSGERSVRTINAAERTGKLRVAVYCRVSTDSADQLNSYASQMRYFTALIAENPDWELADIYADEGESGLSTANRADFLRLMADCRAGKIDRILCKSVSRFARNYTDCIEQIRELRRLGVTVVFEKERLDTAAMNSELLLSVQAMRAQRESLSLSGNVRRGVRMRMKTGTYAVAHAPYGYRYTERTLEIVPEHAAVVQRIFVDYLNGAGYDGIARTLNRDGVPSATGKNWDKSTVNYILANVSYMGDRLYQKTFKSADLPLRTLKNRGELSQYRVENDHAPIISRVDFERAQTLRAKRAEQFCSGEATERLFSKKIYCGECGTLFRFRREKSRVYWVCRTHSRRAELCPVKAVPEDALLAALRRMTDKLREYADEVLVPMTEQLEAVAERKQRSDTRLSDVNRELSDTANRLHALNKLNSGGTLDAALFTEKSNELNRKIAALRQTKSRLLAESGQSDTLEQIAELIETLNSGSDAAELFALSVERLTVFADDTVKIRLKCGLELCEALEKAVNPYETDPVRIIGGRMVFEARYVQPRLIPRLEARIAALLNELATHPELLSSDEPDTTHELPPDALRLQNELRRELSKPDFSEADTLSLIFSLAAEKYGLLPNVTLWLELAALRSELSKCEPFPEFDAEMFKRAVKNVKLGADGAIALRLINDTEISENCTGEQKI